MESNFSFNLSIVSAEGLIFVGSVNKVILRGSEGDIGIYRGHAPLLTELQPSMLTYQPKGADNEFIYVAGGIVEIQPHTTIVLADTVIRATDIDEQHALKTKQAVEQQLSQCPPDKCLKLELEMIQVLAQLRTLRNYQKIHGIK